MRILAGLVTIVITITFTSLPAISTEKKYEYDCQPGDRYKQTQIVKMMIRRRPPAFARMTSVEIDKEINNMVQGRYDDLQLKPKDFETEEAFTVNCGYGNSLASCCESICDYWEENGYFYDRDANKECKERCSSDHIEVQCPSGVAHNDACIQDNYFAFVGMIASDVNRQIRDKMKKMMAGGSGPRSASKLLRQVKDESLMDRESSLFGLMHNAAAPLPHGGSSEKVIINQCRRWCDVHRKTEFTDAKSDLDLIIRSANILLKQNFLKDCYKQCGSPPDFWTSCAEE